MKLHTSPLSYNTLRVDLVLAEKGFDPDTTYELVPADVIRGSHKTSEFLSKSLFGRCPLLEDDDLVLFESRAIGRYLAEKFKESGQPLMPGPGADIRERAQWEMWFMVECEEFNMHGVTLNSQLVIQPVLGNKPDQGVLDRHTPKLFSCLDVLNKHLESLEQEFVAASYFSLVDINFMPLMYMLTHAFGAEKLFKDRDSLRAWWKRVSDRSSWKQVVKKLDDAYLHFIPTWQSHEVDG